jgi:hypothetical protein
MVDLRMVRQDPNDIVGVGEVKWGNIWDMMVIVLLRCVMERLVGRIKPS